ncbi:MAG: biopolymer transporter ExbD [Acidobacteriota bacterium]
MRLEKEKDEAEIPTSSMADIAFLLIIYFMVTTVFSSTRGLEFDLPKEDEENKPAKQEESIYIQVNPTGQIIVDGRPMEIENLLDYVVPKLRINQRKPVIIHPEPNTPYQDMIRVYDELMQSERKTGWKITTVVIPTQREIQEYIDLFGYNPFAVSGG